MKTRLNFLSAVGLLVLCLLTVWLLLAIGAALAGSAPAEPVPAISAGTVVGGDIITDTT